MRKGSFVHDAMMMFNMLVLVVLMVFWSTTYGAQIVEVLMHSSPAFVQQYSSGAISAACVFDGNFTSKFFIDAKEMTIQITDTEVIGSVSGKEYTTDIERGGYKEYGSVAPVPFIKCSGIELQTTVIRFNSEIGDKSLVVAKIGNVVGMGSD